MKITLDIDTSGINTKKIIHKINTDAGLWTFAATEWHRLYKKYVPFETGSLRDTVVIRPKEIEHTVGSGPIKKYNKVFGKRHE